MLQILKVIVKEVNQKNIIEIGHILLLININHINIQIVLLGVDLQVIQADQEVDQEVDMLRN